jgi:hypothetical protein
LSKKICKSKTIKFIQYFFCALSIVFLVIAREKTNKHKRKTYTKSTARLVCKVREKNNTCMRLKVMFISQVFFLLCDERKKIIANLHTIDRKSHSTRNSYIQRCDMYKFLYKFFLYPCKLFMDITSTICKNEILFFSLQTSSCLSVCVFDFQFFFIFISHFVFHQFHLVLILQKHTQTHSAKNSIIY